MDMELNIRQVYYLDSLYCHYPNNRGNDPGIQPCHVYLNLETGDAGADYDPEVGAGRGGAVPADVWHNRTLRWQIPLMTGGAADTLLETLTPLLQRVLEGASIEWNGHNHVGILDEDAESASEAIEEEIGQWAGDLYEEEAADWPVSAADLGVEAGSTDEDLETLAEKLEAEALARDDGAVILRGTLEHLKDLREEAKKNLPWWDRFTESEREWGESHCDWQTALATNDWRVAAGCIAEQATDGWREDALHDDDCVNFEVVWGRFVETDGDEIEDEDVLEECRRILRSRWRRGKVRLVADAENNAEEWWNALREMGAQSAPADKATTDLLGLLECRSKGIYLPLERGRAAFALAQTLPGWSDPEAPEFAPHPFLVYVRGGGDL